MRQHTSPVLLLDEMYAIVNDDLPLPRTPTKELQERCYLRSLANHRYLCKSGTRYDAICRALVADSMVDHGTAAHPKSTNSPYRRATTADVESVKLWRKWMDSNKASRSQKYVPPARRDFADEETYSRVLDANQTVRSVAFRRHFIQLDTSHVGMARGVARDGDEVMVFEGAKTPFVVRRLGPVRTDAIQEKSVYWNPTPTVWTVIGGCYVIGAMDGEIID